MTDANVEAVRRLFGRPGLARLVGHLRERLARGRPLAGVLVLKEPDRAEREALASLLGRSPASLGTAAVRVPLDEIDARTRNAGIAPSLREALELLGGPVANRAHMREAQADAWARVFADAAPAFPGVLRPWLESVRASGLVRRLGRGDPDEAAGLLDAVAHVVAALPARGLPLATLAAERLGDAHALDAGRAVATLSVRAAAFLGGVPLSEGAEGRREVWAGVGVLCDELSSPALVLNLDVAAPTPLGRILREAALAGEPIHVSLRALLRYPLDVGVELAGRDVFVCENPSVVALAADRLGPRSAPLVCANGQPATPVQILLRQLRASGARLRCHTDFDFGGVGILVFLMERFGAVPWRMDAEEYDSAAPRGRALERVPATPWDPELGAAMARVRRAVHEELVVDGLFEDLGRAAASPHEGSNDE